MEENNDASKAIAKKRTRQKISTNSRRSKADTDSTSLTVANAMVVQPDVQKPDTHIVRPTYLVRERSMNTKALKAIETLKDRAGQAAEAIRNIAGAGETTIDLEPDGKPVVISVIEQKITSDKKSYLESAILEKKWVIGKKSVEVPIRYEQLFVNNEQLQKSGLGQTLAEVKDAILKIVPIDFPKKDEKDHSLWIPLFGPDTDMEKTIPLYAEQIVISKKIVKVGDIVIRKREVTELEKIDVGSISEEVTVDRGSAQI